jgi:hypothetical protein
VTASALLRNEQIRMLATLCRLRILGSTDWREGWKIKDALVSRCKFSSWDTLFAEVLEGGMLIVIAPR